MANQHLHMWKISEEQRVALSDSYNHLQVEGIVNMERQRDAWIKASDERAAQLTKRYKQPIELVTTKAKHTQSTCELIVQKCEDEAKTARAELELYRAHIGMDETRIKIVIDLSIDSISTGRLRKLSAAHDRNGQPKPLSYTYCAWMPRTDGRRAEDSTRWMRTTSRSSGKT